MSNSPNKLNYICEECARLFENKTSLTSHIRWKHEKENPNNYCIECDKSFPRKASLLRHLSTTAHRKDRTTNLVKCSLCKFVGAHKKIVATHYETEHNIILEGNNFQFPTMEDFKSWKTDIESKSRSHFVKTSGSYKNKDGSEIINYVCHRDGDFKPKGRNIKRIKTIGSNKIGSHCPARMKVLQNCEEITVDYIETHVGHDLDLERLNLNDSEKAMIAEKLAQNVPFQQILDEMRGSMNDTELKRIHLLTRKDLWNIVNSYNISHNNDNINIESCIIQMQEMNAVKLYKPQNVDLDGHSQLKNEDFFLIVMSDSRIEILKQIEECSICVYATEALNSDGIRLITVTILHDVLQGFPCCFLFSNRIDTGALNLFFGTLKTWLNQLTPKVFISSLNDTLYDAWSSAMTPIPHRLYCSWHVDQEWKNNLNKIKTTNKQKVVYEKVRLLMFEANLDTFNTTINDLVTELINDPDTKEFGEYFIQYQNKAPLWAHCYRKQFNINVNLNFESMHKTVRQLHFDSRKGKRFDVAIDLISKFIKDKSLTTLLELSGKNLDDHLRMIKARHKKSLNFQHCVITNNNDEIDDCWKITSENNKVYTIVKNNVECDCRLRCVPCETCLHAYNCTCIDSCVKGNMCKHAHLICLFLKNKNAKSVGFVEESVGSNDIESSITNFSSDEISIDHETEVVIGNTNEEVVQSSFSDRKTAILEQFLKIYNVTENEEQLEVVAKQLCCLEKVVNSLHN